MYLVEGNTGEVKAVPKTPAGLGFTRPLLMECLESIAAGTPNITLKRGLGACDIEKCSSSVTGMDHLQVLLDDGTMIHATHVIGADGKSLSCQITDKKEKKMKRKKEPFMAFTPV